MDDTQQSRTSDANATRKRRSSILKSQRPPRTPFSELEFNVATPTDAGKSRRVSFSRRTGVAEFVTNEATTTWKNFYEEHNKSLESSGNESGANHSKQPVGHLGNRIFDQQFQEVEAIDFGGTLNPGMNIDSSLNNFTQQLASLECTSDGKLRAPQNNFELSALTDHQSKLFGNDINTLTIGEMSGRIDVNFSAIQQIGVDCKDDLDEIQRDLQHASNNVVCQGPMRARQSLSEYIEVDLNMTHMTLQNDESDMSITDTVHSPKVQDVSKSCSIDKKVTINNDWANDKENIAINPYAAPRESSNFALNEEADKVLVFDGKRLTLQCEKPEKDTNTNYRQTLLPNLSRDVPQRKTIVLNMDDDLPNFVDNPQLSKIETSSITGIVDMNCSVVNNDLSMTTPVHKLEIDSKRRTILDTANISMTQALPSNILFEGLNDKRKSYIYGDVVEDISMTRALPVHILTNNILQKNDASTNKIECKRRTIFDSSANISMTQALPLNIFGEIADKRKSIVYDDEDGNISITRALPVQILTNNTAKENNDPITLNRINPKRRTIIDTSGNISITQALPSNIISERFTNNRTSIKCEDEAGDLSITRALPGHIFTSNVQKDYELNSNITRGDPKRRTIIDSSGNISTTQMLPSNIISEIFDGRRKSVVSGDEDENISMTQALPAPIITKNSFGENLPNTFGEVNSTRKSILDDFGNISITQAIPTNILTMEMNHKRKSVMYGDEIGNMSVTQALPAHIIANTDDKKHRTITYDDDTGNISITQAVPANVMLQDEKRQTIMYDNECVPQAVLSNMINENRRRTVVFEEDAGNISITQSVPANIFLSENKPLQKRQTIVYEDGNISVTQAIPNVILTQQCESLPQRRTILYEDLSGNISVTQSVLSSHVIIPEKESGNNIFIADASASNIIYENSLNIDKSNCAKNRTVVHENVVTDDNTDCEGNHAYIARDLPADMIMANDELNKITIDHNKGVRPNKTVICEDDNVSVARMFSSDVKLAESCNQNQNKSSLNKTEDYDSDNIFIPVKNRDTEKNIATDNIVNQYNAFESNNVSQILPEAIITLKEKSIEFNKTLVYDSNNLDTNTKDFDDNCKLSTNKLITMKMDTAIDDSLIYGRPNVPVVQAYLANITVTEKIEHMNDNSAFYKGENVTTAQPMSKSTNLEKSEHNIDKSIIVERENTNDSSLESKKSDLLNNYSQKKTAQEINSLSVAFSLLSNITSSEVMEENMEVELRNTEVEKGENGPVAPITNGINEESIYHNGELNGIIQNTISISEGASISLDVNSKDKSMICTENNDGPDSKKDKNNTVSDISLDVSQNTSMADALLSNITSSEKKESSFDHVNENQDLDRGTQKDEEPQIELHCIESNYSTLSNKVTQKDQDQNSNQDKESESISSIEEQPYKETQIQAAPHNDIDTKEPKELDQLESNENTEHTAVQNKSNMSVTESLISRFMSPEKKETEFINPVYEGENPMGASPAKLNLTENLVNNRKNSHETYDEESNPVAVKRHTAIENKSIVEPRRLSFAPNRLSIVLSREDLLNNISMAQAALQKSRIDFDDSDIDDVKETQTDDSMMKKSVRMSNEVVKTLHFEDESFSDSSLKSDNKVSPLKKTAFGETTYMKESKAKVIPTFLKDVSDGLKELMSDLVKPMTDVLPFEAAGLDKTVKRTSSMCSTQVQANLVTSSQIEMDCELYSNPESCYNISSSRSAVPATSNPSEKTFKMEVDDVVNIPQRKTGVEAARGHVLVFDHNNPLNNVLIGPMDDKAHKYNPSPNTESSLTLCDNENDNSKCLLNDAKSKEFGIERVSLQYNVSNRLSHAMEGDACSDKNSDIPITFSTISKQSTDQSIDVKVMEVKDTEVNTVIAMKGNKELLDANSSLTLVDEPAGNKADTKTVVEVNGTSQGSPVRVIYQIEEQETAATQKIDSDFTSHDEDGLETSKPTKRNYSATKRDKHSVVDADNSPKPINKMQKLSTSPNVFKATLKSNHASKKTLEKLAAGHDITRMDMDDVQSQVKLEKDKSPRKSKSRKPNTNITIQQVITESNIEANLVKKDIDTVEVAESDSTEPNTQSDVEDCKSLEVVSSNVSENNMKNADSSTTNESQNSAMRTVSRIDWHPALIHEPTSKNLLSECDSGVNVVAKIDMLPFMGSHECEWELSTADTWSFRLLYSRLRLVARLAHRHDNATRSKVRADTILHSVAVEQVIQDKKNPVASLCVRFAGEAMRYMCSRLERGAAPRAGDVPALLRRCAAAARVALRWGRAMQDARLQLAYTLDGDGLLALKVANIPLRSVWEVTMRVELVVDDAREAPWPRADAVRVVPVVSDATVSDGEVRRALAAVPRDWGHAPRTVWKIFRYLKHKTRDDGALLGL